MVEIDQTAISLLPNLDPVETCPAGTALLSVNSRTAETKSPPALLTPDKDDKMGEIHEISDTTTLPREVNRGVGVSFLDPLQSDELAEVLVAQFSQHPSGRIVSVVPGQTNPSPSRQILFHVPNTSTYINLASAERLIANIMSTCECPQGELPSIGDIPLTTMSL